MKIRACLIAIVTLLFAAQLIAANWVKKPVDSGWIWFEDYAYTSATYLVACEPERECQVGMGIFVFGEPRGEKIRFTGEQEITVIGLGSLHIRVADGKGQAQAAILQKDSNVITTPPIFW